MTRKPDASVIDSDQRSDQESERQVGMGLHQRRTAAMETDTGTLRLGMAGGQRPFGEPGPCRAACRPDLLAAFERARGIFNLTLPQAPCFFPRPPCQAEPLAADMITGSDGDLLPAVALSSSISPLGCRAD